MRNRSAEFVEYVIEYGFAVLMLVAILCMLAPAPAMQAATYPPQACVAGQHINFTVNPLDASGKPVALDLTTHAAWTYNTPGIISVGGGSQLNTGIISCLAAGTATATLTVTNNGPSNTTLSESVQVTVAPPPPAVTFGFVFQAPA